MTKSEGVKNVMEWTTRITFFKSGSGGRASGEMILPSIADA